MLEVCWLTLTCMWHLGLQPLSSITFSFVFVFADASEVARVGSVQKILVYAPIPRQPIFAHAAGGFHFVSPEGEFAPYLSEDPHRRPA